MLWVIIGFAVLSYSADTYEMYNMLQPFAIIMLWPFYLLMLIFKK